MSKNEVKHPAHYNAGKIEVWDFIADQKLGYLLGNVVKYACRAGRKNPEKRIEDLEKAKAYLNKQIAVWKAENEKTAESIGRMADAIKQI